MTMKIRKCKMGVEIEEFRHPNKGHHDSHQTEEEENGGTNRIVGIVVIVNHKRYNGLRWG